MDFDGSFSLSSLICQEDEEACLIKGTVDEKSGDVNDYFEPCFVLGNGDEEFIEKLVMKEIDFRQKCCGFSDDYYSSQIWLKCARLDAIEWIFNKRAVFGFQFRTAYLSVDFFDRFLSKRSIDDGKLWAIRLLSVACLSLAAKMEELKVPALSEFQVDYYDFETKVIQRMELLVLSTLDWKMGSITPFVFLHYFLSKLGGECRPKEFVSRAVELIMTVTKEINLMNHRPSAIAAAAVLAVSEGQLTRETMAIKMNVISSCGSQEIEHIYSCYSLMQGIQMGKLNTPNSEVSHNLSSTSSIDVLENSVLTSETGTKRRLTYNDYSQNCPSKKFYRP